MRKLLTKKQREAWLNENWRYGVLTFRYSDGVNGNIVKVVDKRGDIIKGVRCTGGGYDMTGTCLGQFMEQCFPEQIKRLDSREFYGVGHWNTKTKKRQYKSSENTRSTLDGACGMSSMRDILRKIGFKLEYINETRGKVDTTTYILKVA
jgi:hypothetical protein